MGRSPKAHRHFRIIAGCQVCKAIQKKWYAKLEEMGFVDIEYGLENPRFTAQNVNASAPDAQHKVDYFESIWKVFHAWEASGRSRRDCRIAELYAMQEGRTGTVRGISATLRGENLSPWSTSRVQITLKEIHQLATRGLQKVSIESVTYVSVRHKAA